MLLWTTPFERGPLAVEPSVDGTLMTGSLATVVVVNGRQPSLSRTNGRFGPLGGIGGSDADIPQETSC